MSFIFSSSSYSPSSQTFYFDSLPGERFDVSSQCLSQSNTTKTCHNSSEICNTLRCSYAIATQSFCSSYLQPWLDGTRCGVKADGVTVDPSLQKLCITGVCVNIVQTVNVSRKKTLLVKQNRTWMCVCVCVFKLLFFSNFLHLLRFYQSTAGQWSAWSAWSACSQPCGRGVQLRSRACNNPIPKFGGAYCVGNSTDSALCNVTVRAYPALCVTFMCLLTHSLAHLLTHSLPHYLTHAPTPSLTHSFTHSLTPSLIQGLHRWLRHTRDPMQLVQQRQRHIHRIAAASALR